MGLGYARPGATIGSKEPPRRYANKADAPCMKYHLLTAVLSDEGLEVQVEKKDLT